MGKRLTDWEELMNIDRQFYFTPSDKIITAETRCSICEESYSDLDSYNYDDEEDDE